MRLVYLLIRTEHGKTGIVNANLSKFEEIMDLHEVYGRYDIVAKIQTADMDEFRKLVNNKLRILEGIKSIETVFVAD